MWSSPLSAGRLKVDLKRLKPCPGAALDRGGNEPFEVEPMADQLENSQLLLARLAIGGDEIAGDRVSGLAQLSRPCRLDRRQSLLKPVLAAYQLSAIIEHPRQLGSVEIAKYRKVADNIADNAQLRLRQFAIGGGYDHHRVNQRAVMVEHTGSFRGSVVDPVRA